MATSETDPKALTKLEKDAVARLGRDRRVRWVESSRDVAAADERFHAWPDGMPVGTGVTGGLPTASASAFGGLDLDAVHALATGRGVVVAVLDTGVDANHPLLRGHLLGGYDFVDDDPDPADTADGVDENLDGVVDRAYGHGTFVAGLIRQVAPDATIVPVRVLDDEGVGGLASIVEGIDYAVESGAHVINLSLGIMGKVGLSPVKEALKRARKAGVVVAAAAGNAGDKTQLYPASDKDVVAVTALDEDRQELASFANRGAWVDVAAPGVDLVSAVPGGGYARWGGSSMAVAVVSAQLALLLELDPWRPAKQIEDRLFHTCRHGVVKDTGHGVVDVLASVGG